MMPHTRIRNAALRISLLSRSSRSIHFRGNFSNNYLQISNSVIQIFNIYLIISFPRRPLFVGKFCRQGELSFLRPWLTVVDITVNSIVHYTFTAPKDLCVHISSFTYIYVHYFSATSIPLPVSDLFVYVQLIARGALTVLRP
jgi:hypothetical protein